MNRGEKSVQMLVFDWYDGPVGGVVIFDDLRSFYFFMLDWDSEHRVRVFAMQAISDSFYGMIERLTIEEPKWPVWFPLEFVRTSERSQEWTCSIKGLRCSPERIDGVLVWDVNGERAIAVNDLPLPAEAGSRAVSWFDAVETAEGPIDWFAFLSINRK